MLRSSRTAATAVLLLMLTAADLGVFLAVRQWNHWRALNDIPPAIGITVTIASNVVVAQFLLFAFYRLSRTGGTLQRSQAFKRLAAACGVVIFAKGCLIVWAASGLTAFGQLKLVRGRLQIVADSVDKTTSVTGRLPQNLNECGLATHQILDPWGFEIRYEIAHDGLSYRLSDTGVPRWIARVD